MSLAVRTQGLSRRFGAVRAVDGLDLQVPAGRVFGLLGPNGAGKTTTIHLLLGILRPDSGRAEVLGLDVSRDAHGVRRRCGVLLEHDGLYERLSAEDNLRFHGRAHGMPEDAIDARVQELLEPAGLYARRGDGVGTWSRGMKRRLALSRAFLHEPALVFLDEPTSGLDARAARHVRDFVAERAEAGTTVVLTTHDLAEAEAMCDEVAVIEHGRRLAQGPPHRLQGPSEERLVLRGTCPPDCVAALARRRDVERVEETPDGLVLHLTGSPDGAPIIAAAVRAGARLEEVHRVRPDLEEVFLNIVGARP